MDGIPEPVRRYESYSHEAMAAEVEAGNDPPAAGEIGEGWAGLARRLRESAEALGAISRASGQAWEGAAGQAMREALATAADWSGRTTEMAGALSDAVGDQAGIAARARAEMPPPVDFDPVRTIRQAASSGNLLDLIGLSDELSARRAEAQAARTKAIDVMNTRDTALRAAVPVASFDVPPELGSS